MPRSRSTAIQSERTRHRSPRAFTSPVSWIAPPNSSYFSVKVVLPASECETIAKVRRRAISSVRRLINRLKLLPRYRPSLARGPAAPALAVDMMGPQLFANCYRAPEIGHGEQALARFRAKATSLFEKRARHSLFHHP